MEVGDALFSSSSSFFCVVAVVGSPAQFFVLVVFNPVLS